MAYHGLAIWLVGCYTMLWVSPKYCPRPVVSVPTTLSLDSRGRITLPKHLRAGLTDEVVVIKTPHGLVIHPVPRHVGLDAPASQVSGDDEAAESVA